MRMNLRDGNDCIINGCDLYSTIKGFTESIEMQWSMISETREKDVRDSHCWFNRDFAVKYVWNWTKHKKRSEYSDWKRNQGSQLNSSRVWNLRKYRDGNGNGNGNGWECKFSLFWFWFSVLLFYEVHLEMLLKLTHMNN
jgi:hypothetical protein